ncbi:Zinc finger and BTB domain-containing protein 17 [Frankliniella fusca]|uniref:Zinc finger and BTB domain-containing protein 17 n=1 Tax=Frankliniella fusca TaxID=407009 RepID=A0AAE1I1X4_9NEOP|nr:Zinc finger and BTB domain-containing protein 17 [Frankliniella fusca]
MCGIQLGAMKCNWCGEQCGDAERLLAYIIKRHAPKPDVSVASCSKSKIHTQKTDTPVDLSCNTCGKIFKHKRSLKRHERETHSSKTYSCEKCKKIFKNLRNLKQHLKNLKHGSVPSNTVPPIKKIRRVALKYKCRQCKTKFRTLFLLYSHKRSSHSPKYDKYICDGCWRRFVTPGSLRYHVRGCSEKKMKAERIRRVREMCSFKPHVSGEWTTESAIEGDARIHNLLITDLHDLQLTLLKNKESIKCTAQKDLQELRRIKWYLLLFGVRSQVKRSQKTPCVICGAVR